jgi:hypothetical protein
MIFFALKFFWISHSLKVQNAFQLVLLFIFVSFARYLQLWNNENNLKFLRIKMKSLNKYKPSQKYWGKKTHSTFSRSSSNVKTSQSYFWYLNRIWLKRTAICGVKSRWGFTSDRQRKQMMITMSALWAKHFHQIQLTLKSQISRDFFGCWLLKDFWSFTFCFHYHKTHFYDFQLNVFLLNDNVSINKSSKLKQPKYKTCCFKNQKLFCFAG